MNMTLEKRKKKKDWTDRMDAKHMASCCQNRCPSCLTRCVRSLEMSWQKLVQECWPRCWSEPREAGRPPPANHPLPQLFLRHWAYSFWQDSLGFQIWHKLGENNVCVCIQKYLGYIFFRESQVLQNSRRTQLKTKPKSKTAFRLFIPIECYLVRCISLPDHYWDLVKWINSKIKLS